MNRDLAAKILLGVSSLSIMVGLFIAASDLWVEPEAKGQVARMLVRPIFWAVVALVVREWLQQKD